MATAINPDTYMGAFKFENTTGDPAAVVITAGEAQIGSTSVDKAYCPISLTTTGSAAYITGRYIGVSGAATEVTGVGRIAGGTATLETGLAINTGNTSGNFEVWFFDSAVTPGANNTAFGVSDIDLGHLVAVVPFTTWYTSGSGFVSWGDKTTLGVKCAASTTSLWQCVVSRSTAIYEADSLAFKWSFVQN